MKRLPQNVYKSRDFSLDYNIKIELNFGGEIFWKPVGLLNVFRGFIIQKLFIISNKFYIRSNNSTESLQVPVHYAMLEWYTKTQPYCILEATKYKFHKFDSNFIISFGNEEYHFITLPKIIE